MIILVGIFAYLENVIEHEVHTNNVGIYSFPFP